MLAKDTAADHRYNCKTSLIPISEEQLKTFLEKVKGDTTLQDKLKAAKSPEDVVAIAKEHGHEFSMSHAEAGRLGEKELEVLVGGGGGKSSMGALSCGNWKDNGQCNN